MNIRLLVVALFVCTCHVAYGSLVQVHEDVRITGFARLLEEETFLSGAVISIDVYDWNGDLQIAPKKIFSKIINTDADGYFNSYVQKGRWFRLSLHPGMPPSIDKAMADWIQHALPGLEGYSSSFVWLFDHRNSDHGGLLDYIAIDSGLMLADRDYVGSNREISFQVPLAITADVLRALGWGSLWHQSGGVGLSVGGDCAFSKGATRAFLALPSEYESNATRNLSGQKLST